MSNTTREKILENVFDRRTAARIDRERLETIKGLLTWITREKNREDSEELEKDEKDEKEKVRVYVDEETSDAEKPQVAAKSAARADYRLTRLTKLRAIRLKNEAAKKDALALQCRKEKFFNALAKLRTSLLRQQWGLTCHYKERMLLRESIRLKNIARITSEYGIPEILPTDAEVFDKILKYELDKRKRTKLRKERMIKIIRKIVEEMQPTKVCCRLRKATSEISDGESSVKFPTEEAASVDQNLENLETELEKEESKEVAKDFEDAAKLEGIKKLKDDEKKATEDVHKKKDASTDNNNVKEAVAIKEIDLNETQSFPKDNCFFSSPDVVIFDNCKVGKKYSRLVQIVNKTSKWAYIRFNRVYTDVWEPEIIGIDIMDAARVNPGMHSTINVKFSAIYDEKVTAEISFLTLSPDNTKTFHEFRVPVVCKPEQPLPVIDPAEIRFPAAPSWKFDDPKFSEKTLTIANEGRRSFGVVIGERDDREDCFLWHFDQTNVLAASSSVLGDVLIRNETKDDNEGNEDPDDTPRKLKLIEVPSKVKCQLRITFRPRHIGLHHEVMKIYFHCNRIFHKQKVPIWAEVTGLQIHVDPPCIDLGIAMIDADVCQQNFHVFNRGRSSVQITTKTPKQLGDQIVVYPKTTILQPETFSRISVRLMPESTILRLSKSFYDPVTSMLRFPLQVQMIAREEAKPPPLTLKVLATLTTCHGLILEPAEVNLGTVYTHESVYTELTLTNDSLLIQEYGFLPLPISMEVQPNHGFGTILPGETVKLHLIYSARCTDIPGNEIGANGLADTRSFQIEAVTLAELASRNKEAKIDEPRELYRGLPSPHDREPTEIIPKYDDEELENDNNPADLAVSDELSVDARTSEETVDSRRLNRRDRRQQKNKINVHVHIVDTLCEMSEQILEFPGTPCGSFSAVSADLRAYNTASYPGCKCGILKNQEKEFTASFEFKSSSGRVKITPRRGTLKSKQFVKVFFVFVGRLPGTEPKIDESKRPEKSKKRDESKEPGAQKGKKEKKKKTDEDEQIPDPDKLLEETYLLETFEPRLSTIFATCFVDLTMKDGRKREELLFVKLVCPVTKPEIVILNKHPDVSFGPTAIGTSSKKILRIKNISTKSVKVDASLLNPHGSFFAPPGKTIETGSILNLPVTYQPMHSREEEEFFEVSSARTRTRWRLKVSGRGVVPSYVVKPRFGVARIEVIDDKPVEIKISLQNTGQCPLIFQIRAKDTLEGNIPTTADESPRMPRKKGKSEGKSTMNLVLDDALRPHEKSLISEGSLGKSSHPECFSFSGLDEDTRLLVPEASKMEFGIRFQRPKKETADKEKSDEKFAKKKKKVKESTKKEDAGKLNYCYVAFVEVTLGGSVHVQDFVIICSVK